jgi:hypothetical protein
MCSYEPEENDDHNHDDDETPDLETAKAVYAYLEADMVNQIFAAEAKLLREEIRVETTFTVLADDDEPGDRPADDEDAYEEDQRYSDMEDEWMEDEEEEEEQYSESDDEWMEDTDKEEEDDEDEEDEYVDEEDEWVEEVATRGKSARKRTRDQYEEDEETESGGDEDQDESDDDGDDTFVEEKAAAPSPPTKRAKFSHPCVVPLCGKGYANKASLQRHVFSGHVEVSDPVARRACRLLWGETFKGGRLGEVNRRYGDYPRGA